MSSIWTDEFRFSKWLEVEIAVCEAWNEAGEIPEDSIENIRKKADFDTARVKELEKELKHDVIAFLTNVAEYVGDDSRFIHMGLTSSDVLDTALALQLKEASSLILDDIENVLSTLRTLSFQYRDTPMIGRSHGIHAEPRTLGLVFALWYDEMRRNLHRMKRARDVISVGMMSGAVGTYANIPPEIEESACRKLGLRPVTISTQVIQRDIHAEFFMTLALIAATVEKIATDIRHFQRTEVLEMEEPFSKGQKGSSAMPHKRNPVLSENLCGLARMVRSNTIPALENIPLWHERDISHSSVERIIGPDSTILTDFMLYRLNHLLDGLQVYPENLEKNIWITNGLIFSQKVMLCVVGKGYKREDAYEIVQRNAMRSWKEKTSFKKLLSQDRELMSIIDEKELEECFDIEKDLRNIERIFDRVFANN